MTQQLTRLRSELRAGSSGTLEKLAAALISRLVGVSVSVSNSGFQYGGDAGTAGRGGRHLRVECSDRGSQYCSHDFQAALKGYGMRSSMSRKGNCWDNAPTESLWGSMKVGRLYGKRFATHREAMDEVIDWLTFYNHRRLHSTLGYISPMRFESNWHAGQVKKAA
jgi:Integrase core domain